MKHRGELRVRALGWAVAVAGLLGAVVSPGEAEACGGCFHQRPAPPPPGSTAPPNAVQVVTDHRMVLALSAQQTTLWDQIRYAGRPQDFSWILPIRYTEGTRVALSSDVFVTTIDNLTAPVVSPPPYPWPSCPFIPPRWCPGQMGGAGSASTDAGATSDAPSWGGDTGSPVTVLHESVVGPYAVSIIRGTDPMAIREWLAANGYVVPAEVSPVIDHYTQLSMDYVALRLRPGEGTDRMAPVRVTVPGYAPRLPLRMIAAGVADRVGLLLTVFSEGRIEAQNFPNGEVANADLTWDWNDTATSGRQFTTVVDRLNTTAGGRLWLTEQATSAGASAVLDAAAARVVTNGDAGVGSDGGGVASAQPSEDAMLARANLATVYVTRMRANLLAARLDQDLVLAASTRGTRDRQYGYGRQTNIPPPPTCSDGSRYDPATMRFVGGRPPEPCPADPTATGGADGGLTEPTAMSDSSAEWRCAVSDRAVGRSTRGAVGMTLVALAALVGARRRRGTTQR